MKFIRMWLNDGAGPNGRVLNAETVKAAVRNGLRPIRRSSMLPGVIPIALQRCRVLPRPEEIVGLHLHGE